MMNERGLKLFIRGYIYIYTTCSILFEKGMKPLGTGSSEAEVYYLVCKSVYIIQHRAKHRAILKSLFIKKKKKREEFPARGEGPLDADFHSFLSDSSRSFLSFHEEKKIQRDRIHISHRLVTRRGKYGGPRGTRRGGAICSPTKFSSEQGLALYERFQRVDS